MQVRNSDGVEFFSSSVILIFAQSGPISLILSIIRIVATEVHIVESIKEWGEGACASAE